MLANLSLADDFKSLRIQVEMGKEPFKLRHMLALMKKKDGVRFKQVINRLNKGSGRVFAPRMLQSKL